MPRAEIEEPGLDPKEKVRRLVERLEPLRNTIQYSWLIEMARDVFRLPGRRAADAGELGIAVRHGRQENGPARLGAAGARRTKLEAVFLTNDFDDPLEASTRSATSPACGPTTWCSTSAKPEVRQRLEKATNTDVHDAASLRTAIGKLFEHFVAKGARACAISLPPDFRTGDHVRPATPTRRLTAVCSQTATIATSIAMTTLANFVFWTLAEFCAEFKLPFDLMIGVNRGVYAAASIRARTCTTAACR